MRALETVLVIVATVRTCGHAAAVADLLRRDAVADVAAVLALGTASVPGASFSMKAASVGVELGVVFRAARGRLVDAAALAWDLGGAALVVAGVEARFGLVAAADGIGVGTEEVGFIEGAIGKEGDHLELGVQAFAGGGGGCACGEKEGTDDDIQAHVGCCLILSEWRRGKTNEEIISW